MPVDKYADRRQAAQRPKTQADIVFCIDATGSMKPCIGNVKAAIASFVSGLASAADVDFRLRLVAFRDLHDPTSTNLPLYATDFFPSVAGFIEELDKIHADGGGEFRGAESALDALYVAIHSPWRTTRTHKTIVLLTDDNTHPTLHPTTYKRPDNTIERVIQDFQTLRHAQLFMVAPDYEAFARLEQSMKDADRQVVLYAVPKEDELCLGLRSVEWKPLLEMLGKTVSITSLAVAQAEE